MGGIQRPAVGGRLLEELRDALVAAFPSWRALEELLEFELGVPLATVVSREVALRHVVLDLLTWARAQGRLDELVAAARRRNQGNPELAQVEAAIASAHANANANTNANASTNASSDEERAINARFNPPRTTPASTPPTRVPAVAAIRTAILGERAPAADIDRGVTIAIIVDDVADLTARVAAHVQTVARRPDVARLPGGAARALLERGFQPDLLVAGPIAAALVELVSEAPMRAYAVIGSDQAPGTATSASTSWSMVRRVSLAGLLKTRFSKRDHGLARVVARADRRRESQLVVEVAWDETDGDEAREPELLADAVGPGALTGIADGLAALVHDARVPADLPHGVRLKLVHIYDAGRRRNYGTGDVFP